MQIDLSTMQNGQVIPVSFQIAPHDSDQPIVYTNIADEYVLKLNFHKQW